MYQSMKYVQIIGLSIAFSFYQVQVFAQTNNHEELLFLNRSTIDKARKEYLNNPQHITPAVSAVFKKADNALTLMPVSVVEKKQLPPSGDIHDYMSIAPYWWPDSTKPNGVPYIRKDGQRNPEYYTAGDRRKLETLISNVQTLALAYSISKDERYAQAAIRQINVWFIDPGTKMNPNLQYAQSIKGVNSGRGTGIIDTYGLRFVIDAFALLDSSPQWPDTLTRGLRTWFSGYLSWLLQSANGKDEAAAENNHGSIYDVQVTTIAIFVGNNELAKTILEKVGKKRITIQIEPDGSQPLELARTKSWGYSLYNTEALIELANLGTRMGIDLWHFKTSDGRSIKKAVDFVIPYVLKRQQWKWDQIIPLEEGSFYPILIHTMQIYNDAEYFEAAQQLKSKFDDSSLAVFSLPHD